MTHLRRYLENGDAVERRDLEAALRRQLIYGGSLDTVLLELELVNPDKLDELLTSACGLPVAPQRLLEWTQERPWDRVPREFTVTGMVVPLAVEGNDLLVAVHPDLPDDRLGALYRNIAGVRPMVTPECCLAKLTAERSGKVMPQRYAVLSMAYLHSHAAEPQPQPQTEPQPSVSDPIPDKPVVERASASSTFVRERGTVDRQELERAMARSRAELGRARQRDAATDALARAAMVISPSVALFGVKREGLLALQCPAAAFAEIVGTVIPIAPGSELERAVAGEIAMTRLNDLDLRVALGHEIAIPCVFEPIRIRGRPVLMLYVDRGGADLDPSEVTALRSLCEIGSSTLEEVLRIRRGGAPAPAPPPDQERTEAEVPTRPPPPPKSVVVPPAAPQPSPPGEPLVLTNPLPPRPPVRDSSAADEAEAGRDSSFTVPSLLGPGGAPEPQSEPASEEAPKRKPKRDTSPGIPFRKTQPIVGPPPPEPPPAAPPEPPEPPEAPRLNTVHAEPPPPVIPPPPEVTVQRDNNAGTLTGVPPSESTDGGIQFSPPPVISDDEAGIISLSPPMTQSLRGRIGLEEEDKVVQDVPPPSESMAGRVEQAIQAFVENERGVGELEELGADAYARLAARFPGPLEVMRRNLNALPPPSAHGPLIRATIQIGQEMTPHLLGLVDHANPDVRFYAAFVFQELRDPSCVRPLAKLGFDASGDVRVVAMRVLETYHRAPDFPAAVEDIRRELRNPNRSHQLYAARAVGTLRDTLAVPQLVDMLASSDRFIQEAALESLCSITGQQHGLKPHRWKSWYAEHGDRHRVEWIIDSLRHRDLPVRRWAADELARITGHRIPYSPAGDRREREAGFQAWRRWWESEGTGHNL